jgi:threonine synthase
VTPSSFVDTRGSDTSRPLFSRVLSRGQAPGGGLYVPESLPGIALEQIVALAGLDYPERVTRVLGWFGVDVEAGPLLALARQAYGARFAAPAITPMSGPHDGIHLLELWHGPSAAFKDIALQLMPRLFPTRGLLDPDPDNHAEQHLILVATSGDTGKASLEGFTGHPGVRLAVFYPVDGVSELQRLQMVTQPGANVAVFGVRGDFDACQRGVRALLRDEAFGREIAEHRRWRLSSANSINWGRLLPQIVYYVGCYSDLVASGSVIAGEPVDFCVPTGNFGNILAGHYASRIGVPVGRLVCACNENDVLRSFLDTGIYDIGERRLHRTPSPSMDILIASNLERLLHDISGDAPLIRRLIESLETMGRFEIGGKLLQVIHSRFATDSVTNEECLGTIGRAYRRHGLLLDPHTAVAWAVAERTRRDIPMVVVGTAHWAKFGGAVFRALRGETFDSALPADLAGAGPFAVLRHIQERAAGQSVPEGILELERATQRFTEVVGDSPESMGEALLASQSLR